VRALIDEKQRRLADKAEEQNKKKRCCHDLWREWRQA